jgi:hypothetical protein
MQDEANLVRGGDGGTKPISGRCSRQEPALSRPVLHGTPAAALPASEQRPFDFRVAGGLGGFWGWGWEVIETVEKKQLGEA